MPCMFHQVPFLLAKQHSRQASWFLALHLHLHPIHHHTLILCCHRGFFLQKDIVRAGPSHCNCPTLVKPELQMSLLPLCLDAFQVLSRLVQKPFVPRVHQIPLGRRFLPAFLLRLLANLAVFRLLSLQPSVLLLQFSRLLSPQRVFLLLPTLLHELPRTPPSCVLLQPQVQRVLPSLLPSF